MAFLAPDDLAAIGFKSVGRDVRVSDRASIYGAARIEIGDFTRIDDFCVISAGLGGISIGRHVHIACFASVIGAGRITIGDFVGLSSRVSVFSSNDDYSGAAMTGPTLPAEFTSVTSGPVVFEPHCIVGVGSVILPNIRIARGCAIGALSLVTSDCEEFMVYGGVPARPLRPRSRQLLELEAELRARSDG